MSNIPAIQDAAIDHDAGKVPALVGQLDSDDPAVRFYAIQSLQRLTGQTFGYRYFDDADARAPAIGRWRQWLAEARKAGPAAKANEGTHAPG